MAKKATPKSKAKLKAPPKPPRPPKAPRKPKRPKKPKAPPRASGGTARAKSGPSAADAVVNLLQSPLVADLVAVAATAALAALAEHGFNKRSSSAKKTAGKAVKEAGKAAAAAVGRRLSNEVEEIRAAAKSKKRA